MTPEVDERGPGRAARLWAAAELRRRWRAMIAIGALAGLAAGLGLAAVAGARRTDAAYPRLKDETLGADAIVFASQAGVFEPDWSTIESLPYIEASGGFGIAFGDGAIDGKPLPADTNFGLFTVTNGGWLDTVDRPIVLEGRMFDRDASDEVVVDEDAASAFDIEVGSIISYASPSREQLETNDFENGPRGPSGDLRVVGITKRMPFNLLFVPELAYVGPGFQQAFIDNGGATFSNLMVRVDGGAADVRRLTTDAPAALGVPGVPVQDLVTGAKRITSGTDLETNGLYLFAVAVMMAGVVLVQQALTRSVRSGSDDAGVLGSLGMPPRSVASALTLPHMSSAVVAGLMAAVVALALSPRFPIGLGRQVDPDVGLHADWTVVAPGAIAVAVAVALGAWVSALFAVRAIGGDRSRGSVLARWTGSRLPVVGGLGVGLAFDQSRGSRALPSRPALIAGAAGVLGVVGGLTLLAGLDDAVDTPERFGTTWDVTVFAGTDEEFTGEPARALADVEGVDGVAVMRRASLPVDDGAEPVYSLDHPAGGTEPDFVVRSGRAPQRSGEVAVGPKTAADLDLAIGDTVAVGGRDMSVVGFAFLPVSAHSSYDQGLWVLTDDLVASAPAPDTVGIAALITLEPGADSDAVFATLQEQYADIDVDGAAVEHVSLPPEIENLRNVRPLPLLFAVFTLVLAAGAIAHVTASVVRRRRADLGVLRALGLTRGQTRGVLLAQASTLAVVGALVGLPLGIIAGRAAWRWVADATPLVYGAPLAVLATAIALPVAVVLANVVAVLPARRAGRVAPAQALRTE